MAYNLTENQKELARWIIKEVRNGNLVEEFHIAWTAGGIGLIVEYEGEQDGETNASITKGNIHALHVADLLLSQPTQQGVRCTLTGKMYEAVDTDFGATKQTQQADVQREAQMKKPIQVFLCHASEDKAAVMKYYQLLQDAGFKPWIDKEDLLPGQDWDREIRRVIKKSDVALAFFSKYSVSKPGYYQRELKLLLEVLEETPDGQIKVIPV